MLNAHSVDVSVVNSDATASFVYVMHQRDRLLSCQLCGADTPRFPPGGEGMHLMEP